MNVHVRKIVPQRPAEESRAFAKDVIAGLTAEPKRLPAKYFYDERGSQLFEAITATSEYYPTRTEMRILQDNATAIAHYIPPGAAMIEFGSGASDKARILLGAAPHVGAYVPVDISGDFLAQEAARLRKDWPALQVIPIAADFTKSFALPQAVAAKPRVGFFPGSTIGNFEPHEAAAFLKEAARILGPGSALIVGVDLIKDTAILNRAYNDADGVTAAFNLNLLMRINRELGANFNLANFRHHAFYNRERRRIEMHLVSLVRQTARVCGKSIDFRRGESIHTENSYKYSIELFTSLARGAGWKPAAAWVDSKELFSVHALISR
jgi:dimethylhistidine N-methyltransferase